MPLGTQRSSGVRDTALGKADQVRAFLRDEVPSAVLDPASAQAVPQPQKLFLFSTPSRLLGLGVGRSSTLWEALPVLSGHHPLSLLGGGIKEAAFQAPSL